MRSQNIQHPRGNASIPSQGVRQGFHWGKPITRYIDEGRILANLAAKHKRVFRVDSEFRSLAPMQRTTSLCHLAHISIKLGGEKLAWDPDKETFPGNASANKLISRPALRAPWTL